MIQVVLSETEIAIEPGGTVQLNIAVSNDYDQVDQVSLEIEGIDVEWYALPVPTLSLPVKTEQSTRVIFRVPRTSASHAGAYPFLVRARSMETGEFGVQQATLVVKPYNSLLVEVNPKRIAASFYRPENVVDVNVTNLGNHEETLDLYASDPDDACGYEFESDRITIKPGHSETVPLLIEPVTRPIFGSNRLYGFTVTARSVQDSYVTGSAHGQIERRAMLSTLTAAVLALAIFAALTWALLRPKPPTINAFTAAPMQVVAGQPITLTWDASNVGSGSHIAPGNIPVKGPVDSVSVSPTESTTYSLVIRNGLGEVHKDVSVVVTPAPPAPNPRIVSFTTTAKRIHQGDSVTLSWQVEGLNKIVLNPLGGSERDPALFRSMEVKPDQTTTYMLTGSGQGGAAEPKSVTIEVVPPNVSVSQIMQFKAKPEAITAGQKAVLVWQVENATAIDIDNGVGGGLQPKGKAEVSPTQTTTYTLRSTDDKGNMITKAITVTVVPANPVTLPTAPDAGAVTPGSPVTPR